jgi:fucose 4-O-acetylase-like acetyltransferase
MFDDNKISKVMSIAKFLAILSVILAHSHSSEFGKLSLISERLGSIGVVVFLFIAGYYFNPNSFIGFKLFFKKKVQTIFVPWLLTGTLIFFVARGDSLLGWLNWIIGNGTYLYYLTILTICYFLLYYYFKNKIILVSAISLNIISLLLTSSDFIRLLNRPRS